MAWRGVLILVSYWYVKLCDLATKRFGGWCAYPWVDGPPFLSWAYELFLLIRRRALRFGEGGRAWKGMDIAVWIWVSSKRQDTIIPTG